MATATLIDFVEPLRSKPFEDGARLRRARPLTLLDGVLAGGVACVARSQGRVVVALLLRWLGFLLGPVLGLFLLGFRGAWVRRWHALIGVRLAYTAIVLLFTTLAVSASGSEGARITLAAAGGAASIWAAFAGCAITMGVGRALALGIGGRKVDDSP